MTKKRTPALARKTIPAYKLEFLRRAGELNLDELVFIGQYINSLASKSTFPVVDHLRHSARVLYRALPKNTLKALEKEHLHEFCTVEECLHILAFPGKWNVRPKTSEEGPYIEATRQTRTKLGRKK